MKRKPKSRLDGLTLSECCAACVRRKCAISGASYCGHPRKGGLRPAEAGNRAAAGRLIEAENMLKLAAD